MVQRMNDREAVWIRILGFFLFTGILVVIAGCRNSSEIKMDAKLFDAFQKEEEIRIVYAPLTSMDTIHNFPPIRVSRYSSTPPRDFHLPFPVEDPLLTIQRNFVSSLMKRLNPINIRSIRQPSVEAEHLPGFDEKLLSEGFVFKFDTQHWHVSLTFYSYSPPPEGGTIPHELRYSALARLVRNGDANMLWKARCEVRLRFNVSDRISIHQLMEDKHSLIYVKRDEAATECADQFVDLFFQK
jgi:hypothetical protein